MLFSEPVDHIDVFAEAPCESNGGQWVVVVEAIWRDWALMKGTGTGRSESVSFLKGLVELGEVWLVRKHSLQDRSGIAGGIFRRQASFRAKAELIERDSFLFHYRNRHPFARKIKEVRQTVDAPGIVVFEMDSSDPKFTSVFATNTMCAMQGADCLLMGLGAHSDPNVAIQKAIQEYSIMAMDHVRRPGWCARLSQDSSLSNRLPDFHHAQSRDSRNLERIKSICAIDGRQTRRVLPKIFWNERQLPSPIRFVHYVAVSSPDLMSLDFGAPEPREIWESERPLYHPVW
jgi:hypothetical protein